MKPGTAERPASAPAGHAMRHAATLVIGLTAAALLAVALFAHPVGDYHAESDFYGGYADGARAIEHGRIDPARYPVVGPVYECVLALVGFTPLDLFLLAKLLSVLAAIVAMAGSAALVGRRAPGAGAGALFAAWLPVLLAVNPTFFRYGYSATNDMLALALASFALLLLFGRPGAAIPAGAIAALAALTRYSMAVLLPAAALALAIWPLGRPRVREIVPYALGFMLVAAPWTVFSLFHHAIPGAPLFQY